MQKFSVGEIHCSSSADNYRGQCVVVGIWFWGSIIWVWKQGRATEITPLISCVRCTRYRRQPRITSHSFLPPPPPIQIRLLVQLKTRSLHDRQRRRKGEKVSLFMWVCCECIMRVSEWVRSWEGNGENKMEDVKNEDVESGRKRGERDWGGKWIHCVLC